MQKGRRVQLVLRRLDCAAYAQAAVWASGSRRANHETVRNTTGRLRDHSCVPLCAVIPAEDAPKQQEYRVQSRATEQQQPERLPPLHVQHRASEPHRPPCRWTDGAADLVCDRIGLRHPRPRRSSGSLSFAPITASARAIWLSATAPAVGARQTTSHRAVPSPFALLSVACGGLDLYVVLIVYEYYN